MADATEGLTLSGALFCDCPELHLNIPKMHIGRAGRAVVSVVLLLAVAAYLVRTGAVEVPVGLGFSHVLVATFFLFANALLAGWPTIERRAYVPLASWLRGPLRDWAEDLLDSPQLGAPLAPGPIHRMWGEHLSGHRNFAYGLWNVLMFEAWRRRWVMP